MNVQQLYDLSGRVALVTGGSIGLGRQMAEGLAEAGADVAIANRRLEMGMTAAEELSRLGVRTLAVSMDVTEREQVVNAVRQIEDELGPVDILVNNAGISLANPLATDAESLQTWRKVMEVNVGGAYLCTSAVAPGMKERRHGKIINISSIYGANGIDRSLYVDDLEKPFALHSYAASKGAVVNLTRDLAASMGHYNVNVNAILPATFVTDQNRHILPEKVLERIRRRTPLGRTGAGDDLKGVVVFLASEASKYVTGQMLAVDGGWLCW